MSKKDQKVGPIYKLTAMMKTVITSLLILISLCGKTQENLFNQSAYCFMFCGTTAQDTNTFSFLKSSYENAILNLKDDSLLILLELSEDEIFIQRHERANIISSLYELEVYNLGGEKSKTGKFLQDKYAGFYFDIIQQSLKNPKIVLRGYKNQVQNSQIGWIRKYYPELISESDSIEILNTLRNKMNLGIDLHERIKVKLNSISIDNWDKAYIGTWLDDLIKFSSNELYPYEENYWGTILKSVNKKIILSPYEQAKVDYTPLYLKRYFYNPTRVLLLMNKAVLTDRENYKTIKNKKYKPIVGFVKYNTNEKICLFDNVANKYKSMKLIEGSYYGNW